MKTLVKLLVVLAGLSAVCLALAVCLQKDSKPEYISIYGKEHKS